MKRNAPPAAADPTVRYAKLKLDGETYSLAFDFNAMALAEEMSGLNLLQALRSLRDLSVSQTRALLYAALLKKQPKMTLVQAGDLLNFRTLPLITAALGEALAHMMPEETEENPPQPEPEPAESQ